MPRPAAKIPLLRWVRYAIMALALVLFGVLIAGPTWVVPVHGPSGLPYHELAGHGEYASDYLAAPIAQRALAIFVVCMALWLTNLIPLASTGLLAVGLLPLLGVAEAKQAFAYFGSSAVFFIISVFLLAAAMIRTGLSKRLTLLMLQRFDRRPGLLVVGITASAAFLALWMPAYAVAAMMFPVILEIADSLELERGKSGYARKLFFGLAWGTVIGSCGTILGGARAPLAMELLRDTYRDAEGAAAYPISFLQWMGVSMPLVVVMTALAIVALLWVFPSEVTDITRATRMLNVRVKALGGMSGRERRLALLMLATIACWVSLGTRVDVAVIAVVAAVGLAVFRIVSWQETQEYMNWGVVVMYGGAIALGAALKDTHAMLWVAQQVLPNQESHPMLLLVLMAVLTLVMSCAISNAAAVAVLLPVGYALCEVAQPAVHPLAMTYAVALASGFVFPLPISSPPLAICSASGHYPMRDVPKYGIPFTLLAIGVVITWMLLYWPLIGLSPTL